MRRLRITDRRSEAGTSLILALAMVTLISVALVAALGFATASLRTVSVIKQQGGAAYSADGAINTAFQVMRYSATAGTTAVGSACPAVNYSAVGNQPAVAVTCRVVASRTTGGPGASMPPYSIWAVGNSPAEAGIAVEPGATLDVNGPVASNSPADGTAGIDSVSVGTLDVSGFTIDATGSCSGTITVTAPADKRCATGLSDPDPAYPSETLPAVSAPNPAPTCAADNAVLQFSPGYYTNTAVFESPAYVQGTKTCKTGYLMFKQGVYYFDFGFDPAFPDTIWNVTQTVSGGLPKGWDPTIANSVPPAPGGGAATSCKTERDGATQGVQFVFGGASQMNVTASGATVELCADPTPAAPNKQQIAIYGQKAGSNPTAQTVMRVPTNAVPTPATPPPVGWSGVPTNVLPISPPSTSTIDTQVASYTMPVTSPVGANGSVLLSGYAGWSPTVPAGSVGVSYELNVAHQETSADPADIKSLTATIGACALPVPQHDTPTLTAPVTDTIPLTSAACIAAIKNNFKVTFTATAMPGKNFTENLDGIDLVVKWTPPAVRPQSGCTIAINGCPVLDVGSTAGTFVVWGTVYTPLASVNADVQGTSTVEFRRGVVARAVTMPHVPSGDSTGSFCLGAGSPCIGPARVLLLTATVSGKVKLRALVRISDAPALGYSAQILSWNVLRG